VSERREAPSLAGKVRIQTIAVALEEKLSHRFKDRYLLACALTHPSAVKGNIRSNQRLEFLGDRVLGLAVADMLYTQYSRESEGALARRFSALVRREALERIARQLNIGEYLILGKGEDESGGRENSANLADACEAVIGALFVDGGYKVAADFVREYWSAPMAEDKNPPRDSKTTLQEWAQENYGVLPSYHLTGQQGPAHAPQFEIEARVGDMPGAVASGGSKQAAEQAAAKQLLQRIVDDND